MDELFAALLDAPVMHVDGRVARVNETITMSLYAAMVRQPCILQGKIKDMPESRILPLLKLIQDMIHENNTAPAEGMAEEKITEFEARYDAIVERAGEEYGDTPPSDYYRDGYNLYLRMVEYKHNHLLFLSNQKPIQPKSEKLQSANTTLSEYKAG